jgi:hypothetical protein
MPVRHERHGEFFFLFSFRAIKSRDRFSFDSVEPVGMESVRCSAELALPLGLVARHKGAGKIESALRFFPIKVSTATFINLTDDLSSSKFLRSAEISNYGTAKNREHTC